MATEASRKSRAAQHGLTLEQMEKMLSDADGKCNLCGTETDRLNIDHCHNTGAVRGILCTRCNTRLGGWDDREWMLKAADYMGAKLTLWPLQIVKDKPVKKRVYPNGQAHPRAKLQESDVRMILQHAKQRTKTQVQMAREFNVSRHTISMICCGASWPHIQR